MTELGKNVSLSGQCFPVRSLTKHNVWDDNVGGAWLVAYKAEQRRRFKAVLCRDPDVVLPEKPPVSKQRPRSIKSAEKETRRKLDGFYLMSICHVSDPLDLCSINISGKGLTQVKEEDFLLFKNVIHVDAGENNLQLMHFRNFPCLQDLELPLNNLSGTINVGEKDFLWLKSLDLSCNSLTSNDVLTLGILSSLKVLHLTGNQLSELPHEMSRSYLSTEGHRNCRFASLEKLWLDQNNLTDENTFTSLAGLKRLKYLNLENNDISSIPQLKLLESKPNLPLCNDNYGHLSKAIELRDPEGILALQPTEINELLENELADVNSRISSLENRLYHEENKEMSAKDDPLKVKTGDFVHGHFTDNHVFPFPSLQHLNLANNHIEDQEGLLSLSTWPRLAELVIWGNPVASCGKQGHPIVSYHLGRVAGIEIIRREPPKKSKPLISLALNKRRVRDLPPMSYNKNLLMLNGFKRPEIDGSKANENRPLPPITAPVKKTKEEHVNPKRVSSAPLKRGGGITDRVSKDCEDYSRDCTSTNLRSNEFHTRIITDGQSTPLETTSDVTSRHEGAASPEDRVFLTQVDDIDNDEVLYFSNDQPQKSVKEMGVDKTSKPTVPKRYNGYEDLLNIDDEFPNDVILPEDIQGNVRALQYALDHPLVFTEQSIRYRKRKKTKHTRQIISTKNGSRTTTVEELESILEKMRTHSKTVESNLGDVLEEYKNPRITKELKEAKKLLSEVQTKYNEVRSQSLSSTAIVADLMQRERLYPPSFHVGEIKQKAYRESDKLKSANDLKKFKERVDSRI